jgi:hypothetical protein
VVLILVLRPRRRSWLFKVASSHRVLQNLGICSAKTTESSNPQTNRIVLGLGRVNLESCCPFFHLFPFIVGCQTENWPTPNNHWFRRSKGEKESIMRQMTTTNQQNKKFKTAIVAWLKPLHFCLRLSFCSTDVNLRSRTLIYTFAKARSCNPHPRLRSGLPGQQVVHDKQFWRNVIIEGPITQGIGTKNVPSKCIFNVPSTLATGYGLDPLMHKHVMVAERTSNHSFLEIWPPLAPPRTFLLTQGRERFLGDLETQSFLQISDNIVLAVWSEIIKSQNGTHLLSARSDCVIIRRPSSLFAQRHVFFSLFAFVLCLPKRGRFMCNFVCDYLSAASTV